MPTDAELLAGPRETDVATLQAANLTLGREIVRLHEMLANQEQLRVSTGKMVTAVWADHERQFKQQQDEIAALRARLEQIEQKDTTP